MKKMTAMFLLVVLSAGVSHAKKSAAPKAAAPAAAKGVRNPTNAEVNLCTKLQDLKQIDDAVNTCLNSDDGMSTLGMVGCLSTGADGADVQLNRHYRDYLALFGLTPGANNLARCNTLKDTEAKDACVNLVEAERAWVKLKEHDCDSYPDQQGSIWQVTRASCAYDITFSRAKSLLMRMDANGESPDCGRALTRWAAKH